MEVLGNSALFMRTKIRQRDGSFEDVPFITGDTCRHQLREASSKAYLAAAGLDGALSEGALRLLFAGGMLTGKGDAASVNLDEYRTLCDLFPPLALFGGCVSNRTTPGRLRVSSAQLICMETYHLLPAWIREYLREESIGVASCREHITEETRVRMDPTLDPSKRLLLTDEARRGIEQRLLASEKASAESDAIGAARSKSTMLPRSHETLCAGSLFYWRVTADTQTDLDLDTLRVAIGAWLTDGYVGGKRGVGHGKIRVVRGSDETLRFADPSVTPVDFNGLALSVGQVFKTHVAERREKIAKWIKEVNA
jgi:hypothetical protein